MKRALALLLVVILLLIPSSVWADASSLIDSELIPSGTTVGSNDTALFELSEELRTYGILYPDSTAAELATYSISSTGTITLVDNASIGVNPYQIGNRVEHVVEDIYAYVYSTSVGGYYRITARTQHINDGGAIGSVIQTLQLSVESAYDYKYPSIIKVPDTEYYLVVSERYASGSRRITVHVLRIDSTTPGNYGAITEISRTNVYTPSANISNIGISHYDTTTAYSYFLISYLMSNSLYVCGLTFNRTTHAVAAPWNSSLGSVTSASLYDNIPTVLHDYGYDYGLCLSSISDSSNKVIKHITYQVSGTFSYCTVIDTLTLTTTPTFKTTTTPIHLNSTKWGFTIGYTATGIALVYGATFTILSNGTMPLAQFSGFTSHSVNVPSPTSMAATAQQQYKFAGSCSVVLADSGNICTLSYNVEPDVSIDSITNVTETGFRVSGTVVDVGSFAVTEIGACWNTIGYPTKSDSYTGVATFIDVPDTPYNFSIDVSGVDTGTLHYVRTYATNAIGSGYSTTDLPVQYVGPPSNLTVNPVSSNACNLSWTKGIGAEMTMIRGAFGSYPSGTASGTEVYYGSGTTTYFSGPNFAIGTYYFRAWSRSVLGLWSEGYAQTTTGYESLKCYIPVYATNSSTNSYDALPVSVSLNNEALADGGYISEEGLDVKAFYGTNRPVMVADDRTMFVLDFGPGEQAYVELQLMETPSDSFYLIPGHNGYVTTSDSATLEPGSNDFELTIVGWVDPTSSGTLARKSGALELYVSGTHTIAANVYTGATCHVEGTIDEDYHTVTLSRSGGTLSLVVDTVTVGSTSISGSVVDNTNNWTFMSGNSLVYAESISWKVGGSTVLRYKPERMVRDSTVEDLVGSNDGTITWGSNVAEVSVDPLVCPYEATYAPTIRRGTTYVTEIPNIDTQMESGGGELPLLEPVVRLVQDYTNLPAGLIRMLGALMFCMIVGVGIYMYMQSLVFVAVSTCTLMIAFWLMDILPYWIVYPYCVIALAMLILRRAPSL